MSKLLSVIIPTCHRNDLLSLCLNRLAPGQQSLGFEHYEVIVSDDGLDSTAADMIAEKYPWVNWVKGPRRGPAANRNHGARQATGEWLVFTDDDCLPDISWLSAYFDVIKKNDSVKVFEGRTYVDRERRSFKEEAPINEKGGYLWSCNFAINRLTLNDIGGFDEGFPYAAMEDVDLHYRLKKNSINIPFLKEASVCHPWRKVNSPSIKLKRHASVLYYLEKHPDEKKRINARFSFLSICKQNQLFFKKIIVNSSIEEFIYWFKSNLYSLLNLASFIRHKIY